MHNRAEFPVISGVRGIANGGVGPHDFHGVFHMLWNLELENEGEVPVVEDRVFLIFRKGAGGKGHLLLVI